MKTADNSKSNEVVKMPTRYGVPPSEKTIAACYNHGHDHGERGWARQPDPQWSNEQQAAYRQGYDARYGLNQKTA